MCRKSGTTQRAHSPLFFWCGILHLMPLDEIKTILDYNPDTGIFRWKVNRPPLRAGDRAGCELKLRKPSGVRIYRSIRIKKKHYTEHRLAWRFFYGEIPEGMQIDHINRNPSDNRIANLRLVNQSQNNFNSIRSNKSGHRGVYKHSQSNCWCAELSYLGKKVFRKCYPTKKEAVKARKTAERSLLPKNFQPPD